MTPDGHALITQHNIQTLPLQCLINVGSQFKGGYIGQESYAAYMFQGIGKMLTRPWLKMFQRCYWSFWECVVYLFQFHLKMG